MNQNGFGGFQQRNPETEFYKKLLSEDNFFEFNRLISSMHPQNIPNFTNQNMFNSLNLFNMSKLYFFLSQYDKLGNSNMFYNVNVNKVFAGLYEFEQLANNQKKESKKKFMYYLYPYYDLSKNCLFFTQKTFIGFYLHHLFVNNPQFYDMCIGKCMNSNFLRMFILSILQDKRVKNMSIQYNCKNTENYNIINIEYIGRYFPGKLFDVICYRQNEKATMLNLMYHMIANLVTVKNNTSNINNKNTSNKTMNNNTTTSRYFGDVNGKNDLKTNKICDKCFFYIIKLVTSDIDLIELSNNWIFRQEINDFVKQDHLRNFIFELIKMNYFEESLCKLTTVLLIKSKSEFLNFGLNLDKEFNWIFTYPKFNSIFYIMNVILQCLQKSISLENINGYINKVNIEMEKIICELMNKNNHTEGSIIIDRLKIDIVLELKIAIQILYCIKCGGDRKKDIYSMINDHYVRGKNIHDLVILLIFFNVDFDLLKSILKNLYKDKQNLYKDKRQLLEIHSLITCLYGKDIYSKYFLDNQLWDVNLYDKITNVKKKKILFFSLYYNSNGTITRDKFTEKFSTVEPFRNQPLNLDEFYDFLIAKLEMSNKSL